MNKLNNTSADSEEISNYPLHKVPHIKQRFHWDCGVTCVLMLLSPDQREYFLQNFEQICEEEGFGESTWTIDLCYLLKRFGIKHTMYTSMPGVNEDYKRHSYYKNIIDIDRSRVEQKFSEAAARGVAVRAGALPAEALAAHAAAGGAALLLVDAGRLACDLCRHNKIRKHFRWCLGGFLGHYVLVAGGARGRLLYRDPARRQPLCAAQASALAAAAGAPGTDSDCVLIHWT